MPANPSPAPAHTLRIGGITPLTTIDFPGRLAAVLYCQGLLDGVVFSGGEPTLQAGLPQALEEVRALGFATALHTGGMYPERLAAVLPLLDWVGLDIKGPEHRYADITGAPGSGARAFESLALLQASPVAFECRTTWHAGLYEAQELQALGDQLAGRGVRHWAVQVCRHVPGAPDVTPSTVAAPVGAQIPRFEVRGGQRGAVG